MGIALLGLGLALSVVGLGTVAAAPLTLGMVSLLPSILGTVHR